MDEIEDPRESAFDLFHRSGAQQIGRIAGGTKDAIFAARLRFEHATIATEKLVTGVLICRTAGTASISRNSRGATVRRRPAIGSISYVCPDTPSVWCVEGPCESCHVYLRRERLRAFAESDMAGGTAPAIDDLFGVQDPWLTGYFQMVVSELDAGGEAADALFVSQAEQILIHHLLRRHSHDAKRVKSDRSRHRAHPLHGTTLRRIEDYIDANIGADIALGDLAAIACMSVGHFLRAFRATAGITPYQYVLKRRLSHACDILRSSSLPVGDIARRCGFKTASHLSSKFHASFGRSPSSYRERSAARSLHAIGSVRS